MKAVKLKKFWKGDVWIVPGPGVTVEEVHGGEDWEPHCVVIAQEHAHTVEGTPAEVMALLGITTDDDDVEINIDDLLS